MFRHRLFRTFAGLCVLLGAAFSGYTQIVIDGAADRSIHTDSASFRVQAIAGTTTTATLNGQPIAGGVFHTITRMDHYELAVRQVRDADGAVSTATRQFIVRSSQRGSPETGLIAWTPYPQIDSTAAEFSGATLHLVTPTAFPAGLPIPVVAWVAEGQDRVRRANGWITAPGFEANPIRLLRGWGSGLLPAADGGGSLEFQARLHDLQNAKTIPIEAGTAWTPVSGVLNGAVNWPPDSRIHITGHVGIPANASLTIGAGTVVKLNPLATITNLGRVVINGTLDRPVVLTATNPVAPHQHTHAWGGFILRGSGARLEARGAILMGGGGASNFRDELGPSHRDEQPVLLLSDGARAALTNCYIINTAGQVGNGLNADVTYDHCLIQRAITAGEYEGGTVIVNHSALIEFPADNGEVDATIADSDYDGIYFTTGTHILLNSLLGFAKDDAIDSGSGGAGTVVVSNCWVESALHEALAWSGGGRQTWTYDTVVMNCGQGIECGWSEGGGVSPDCFAERLLSIGNSVGARFGDNYDWTYNGFLRVTNSLLLHNYRDIWGLNWDDWTYRVAQMDLRGNWTSTVNTNHPENVLWNPAAHASRLAPYLTAPPGAPVGIGFAVWPHEAPAALLTNGIPVRLSCFTTHPVSVEYAVQTQAGEVESGSLTFQPGETVRHIRVQTGGLINEDLARVVLRRPTGGELTGTSSFFIARPPPPVTPSSTTLIPTGATWKYADFGTDQGAAWRLLSFNDTTWPSGPAELGNGDGDEMTRINIGPSGARYPTVYFRRRFVVENPSVFESLLIRMKCDDGGIVWINNQPVFRQNMPADPINYSTYTGRSTPSETAYFSNVVSAVVLTPGTNICAVEVHQGDAGSSDLSFDLGLVGIGRPPAPPLHLRALGSDHVLLWNAPGFVLERSTGLPGNWVPVAGATSPYVIPRRSGNQFFRLHRP